MASASDDQNGLTRTELLRRGLVAGGAIAVPGLFLRSEAVARAASHPFAASVKRGGTLRVGIAGGGSKDTLDAHESVTGPDQARVVQLFEPLATFDDRFQIRMLLAEEISGERPDLWTIRVRPDVEFHNGKTLSADDVIHTLRRILSPKVAAQGKSGLSSIDPLRIKKLDKRTVRLHLKQPNVTIADELAQYWNGIIPVGYDPKHPVGTGPFMLKSFSPGQQSVFVRNPHYWQSGRPYLDSVVIIDFPDDTARVNALLGGQVQTIDSVPFAQAPVIKGRQDVKLLESAGGQWIPFTMRTDQPPFTDKRVRQAFRLIVDRPQMIQQALANHGRVANDLFAPFDPAYDHAIPQRRQNLQQAKSLLRQAGKSDLAVTIATAPFAAGAVEAAQVFAQQAKGAGVSVNVKSLDSGTFYGPNYLKWTFAQDFWNTRNYLPQVAAGMLPTSPYNEPHWKNPRFVALHREAMRTLKSKKRDEIIHEMQKIEWDDGGLIIWGFNNFLDAYSSKVTGFHPSRGQLRLNRYGFSQVSFV